MVALGTAALLAGVLIALFTFTILVYYPVSRLAGFLQRKETKNAK